MKSFRENPDGAENQSATKQNEREVFAAKMMTPTFPPGFNRVMPVKDGAVYEAIHEKGRPLIVRAFYPNPVGFEIQHDDGSWIAYPEDVFKCWRLLVPAEEVEKAHRLGVHAGYDIATLYGTSLPLEVLQPMIEEAVDHHARRVVEGGV